MSQITIPYKPRDVFLPYHENTKRLCVTVAHRRAGKTVARINRIVKDAVICSKHNPRFSYLAPYYVQAKDIAWVYLKHYTAPFIPYGLKINESELSVTLPHNNAQIKLYGAENGERMRGTYQDGIVVDEGQGIKKQFLTAIILPSLADRQGWLDVSGTPKGWENLLGELVLLAKRNPDQWFLQILKASETGIINPDELLRLRALMPENEFLQEFECDFDAAITGSVYGKWMAACEARFKEGIYNKDLPVYTSWDLGYDDSTAIWFWQKVMGEVRWIDYYENSGQNIGHYCDIVIKKGYKYGDHYVPHDAAHELLAAGGRSIVQQAHALGVKMKVVHATSQMNGIEALRKVLDISWFDPVKCASGVSSLKQYQFEFDEDKKIFRNKPRHDWASHACDAAEIVGQVFQSVLPPIKPTTPRFLSDMTADELFFPKNPTILSERI